MTDQPNQPKTYFFRLEDDALDTLRAYKKELDAMVSDKMHLQQRFKDEIDEMVQFRHIRLQHMWYQMAVAAGLPPETTWGSPEYGIEIRYLNENFGGLIHVPNSQAVQGQVAKDDAETTSQQTPPTGTTVH